jgi:ethanolamine utilization protein EutN
MLYGKVIGQATSTVKHPSLEGWKLLVVQPLAADGKSPDADPVLTIDTVGAGAGNRVFLSSDGRFARELVGRNDSPIRWTVLGICD